MAYDVHFITGYPIELPRVPANKKDDIAPLLNGKGFVIDYLHHSVVMNKKRKFAFFTASNISGKDWKTMVRKGSFKKDTKSISASFQFGNELYDAIKANGLQHNDFEQGHLTSFQEVIWGNPEERIKAAGDTFYFTNCVPQHERVNSGLWRSLEQYILKTQTIGHELKVTVLTGPLLSDSDPWFIKKVKGELVKIPCVFWKVVYYPNHKGLNAVGFMMSQTDLLLRDKTVTFNKAGVKKMLAPSSPDDLFMNYKYDSVYQVRVEFIQEKTGLQFMLKNVHLPYQVKTHADLIYKKIEVPAGRARAAAHPENSMPDFELEGITL